MRRWISSLALGLALPCLGCGTWLSVSGAGIDDTDPGGIAVNQTMLYQVEVTNQPGNLELKATRSHLLTVDPGRVTSVNWKRMPFSSGELQLKLTKEQTLKEVTLIGSTGAARAANAGSAVVDAVAEIEKARAEDAPAP